MLREANVLKKIAVIIFGIAFPIFLQSQVSCPYPFSNNLSCNVGISYEIMDGSCVCPVQCGPHYLNCLMSGSPLPPGVTNLSGPNGTCCNFGFTLVDVVIRLDDIDCQAISIWCDNGCNSGNTTPSGNITPATSAIACGSSTWSMNWTSSGCSIGP
jgi:hypothetical protein